MDTLALSIEFAAIDWLDFTWLCEYAQKFDLNQAKNRLP
jgi:hypothetical protein